jgi:urate oxidase
MLRVGASSQGESRLRMLRVVQHGDRHDPRDLTVSIRLEGGLDPASPQGGAGGLIPPETIKVFAHRVAREHGAGDIETFGLAVCRQMLETHAALTRVRVEILERPWMRLDVEGKAQGRAFTLGGPEVRTAHVTSNGAQTAVVSGIDRLVLMRTSGFLPQRPTGRADDGTEDAVPSLLVGSLSARWTYGRAEAAFGAYRQGIRRAITHTFSLHATRSVPFTLHAIGDVVLATYEDILDVSLTFSERPYPPADLFLAVDQNPDDLFVAADEPLNVVKVTVERDRPV